MSWYKRYEVLFQSRLGDQYAVNIYEQSIGSVVRLTGSDVPFVTQEDDDEDIFNPMRIQTGYLRIVDNTESGMLIEQIMPSNNLEKLVRVYANPTSSFEGNLVWVGFMCAEAFTQPWDKQAKVIEFPVKSLLGAMEDVSLGAASGFVNFATLICSAFTAIGYTPDYVHTISNLDDVESGMLKVFIEQSLFINKEEEQNEGSTQKVLIGESYATILSEVAKLYGVTFRMQHNTLFISMYDNGAGKIGLTQYSWADIVSMSAGGTISSPAHAVPIVDLLESSEFCGKDNDVNFVQGGREGVVVLNLKEGDDSIIELPITDEDTSTVYEILNNGQPVIYRGQVFVQPHPLRINSIETFQFFEYQTTGAQTDPTHQLYTQISESNYNRCLNNSVIFRPLFNPRYSTSDHLHTGEFPVRWMYKKDAQSQPQMKSGMMMNTMYLQSTASGEVFQQVPDYCYKLQSLLTHTLLDGYLHINMLNYNFMRGGTAADENKLYFGEFTSERNANRPHTRLYCMLTIGTRAWTPENGWQPISGRITPFVIEFDGDRIISNKTTEMSVDETEGFFVSVPSDVALEGTVSLYILNMSFCSLVSQETGEIIGYRDAHCRIIADLTVDFLSNIDPMASRRSSNTYRRNIMSSGFSDEKSVTLTVGTNNNNIPSDSFICSDIYTQIESLPYYYEGGTENERPEKNLLSRLVAHYGEVRRAFIGVLKSRFSSAATYLLYDMRYSYLGRNFFAVVKKKNWREDTQDVKFIEVS